MKAFASWVMKGRMQAVIGASVSAILALLVTPLGLISADGKASGILEDTRRGKRLFDSAGTEMISGHLSCFGYRDAAAAVGMIAAASGHCRRLNIPALFAAIPNNDADAILEEMPTSKVVKAPATVFGYAFDQSGTWSINTAEI